MKIRELLNEEQDLDVFDDLDERCHYALCPPLKLTDAGEQHFAKVLDMDVDVKDDTILDVPYRVGVVHTETEHDAEILKDFILDAAGYCSESEWQAWFKEGEDNDYIF